MFCTNKLKQLSIFEQITELSHLKKKQPIGLIKLLSENFDIQFFIPESFTQKYYVELGRDRKYKLTSVLSALILIQIFHISTTVLLNLFLIFSTEIRDFCCFYDDIPDESFFSRFKTGFELDIAGLFNAMVPSDSPNKDGNSKLIYDTSG